MAKKKSQPANPAPAQEQAAEAVLAPMPAESVELSLEQVARKRASELTPAYKEHHLASIQAYCRSQGLPESGSEEMMLLVLKRYGYKI